jgi:hypothetical protein
MVSSSLFSIKVTNVYLVNAQGMQSTYLCWPVVVSIGPERSSCIHDWAGLESAMVTVVVVWPRMISFVDIKDMSWCVEGCQSGSWPRIIKMKVGCKS